MKKELEELAFLNGLRDDLKQFKSENIYCCPYCEKIQEWDNVYYNAEESTYTCSHCKETFNEDELEHINAFDYFADMFITYKSLNIKEIK